MEEENEKKKEYVSAARARSAVERHSYRYTQPFYKYHRSARAHTQTGGETLLSFHQIISHNNHIIVDH